MRMIQTSEPVRVLFHQNGGFTKLAYERYEGKSVMEEESTFDFPTSEIPESLRAVGSRFMLTREAVIPGPDDSLEEIRAAKRIVSINPIP